MEPWKGRYNAEVYDRFVREHSIYRVLNQRLVELAHLETARRVLDLACGTGATALASLAKMASDAELVGIDASEEMVDVARTHIVDPRAEFVVATAASIADATTGLFDRAVCNAGFWQFPAARPVLAGLAERLAAGATFVFNVPADRVKGETAPVHPFQAALARQLEARTGQAFDLAPSKIDGVGFAETAGENGFNVAGRERFVYHGTQGELAELMGIPAMIEPLAPSLEPEDRESALEEARSKIDSEKIVEVPWIYFTLVRKRA